MIIALLRRNFFAIVVAGLALFFADAQAYEFQMVEQLDAHQSGVVIGGTVVPYKEVTLAAQVPGRIEFIAGDVGDKTKFQQVLTKINDDDLLARRKAALAQISQAQSSLQNAQLQYSRELWSPSTERMSNAPGGMGMPFMFDKFFTQNFADMTGNNDQYLDRQANLVNQGSQYSQAQSALMQAYSALEEIDAGLRDTHSLAPFDGVILKRLVEVGDTVQPGQPMLEVGRTDYLRVQAEIPARLIPLLKRGEFVPAKLDVADTIVQARVSQIYPVADPGRHTVTVKFDLPKGIPGGPGMYVEVTIPEGPGSGTGAPILVVAKQALVKRGSLPYVFVKSEDGSVNLRLVRLGREISTEKVIVLSGLQAGEQVLLDPPSGLSSGWRPSDQKSRNVAQKQ